MKRASGLIVLLLAALLVAMPVSAFAVTADNGALALTDSGTKIIIQEEVGGIFTAENVIALAVVPNEAQAVFSTTMLTLESRVSGIYEAVVDRYYKPTPGAGGDGLLARFS